MKAPAIMKYLGLIIIAIFLLLDFLVKDFQLSVMVIGLCIGAVISIVGFCLERRNKNK